MHLTALAPLNLLYKNDKHLSMEFHVIGFTALSSVISHLCWSPWHLCLYGTVYGRFWLFLDSVASLVLFGVLCFRVSGVDEKYKDTIYFLIFFCSITSWGLFSGQFFFYDKSLCSTGTKKGYPFGPAVLIFFGVLWTFFTHLKRIIKEQNDGVSKIRYWNEDELKGVLLFFFGAAFFMGSTVLEGVSYNLLHGIWHFCAFSGIYFFLKEFSSK